MFPSRWVHVWCDTAVVVSSADPGATVETLKGISGGKIHIE